MNRPPRKRRPPHKSPKPKQRPSGAVARAPRNRPSGQTFEEVKYLKSLIANRVPVVIRLRSNDEVAGVVEYYDANFLRLTRKPEPNLFIYKHDIKYLYERPTDSAQDVPPEAD